MCVAHWLGRASNARATCAGSTLAQFNRMSDRKLFAPTLARLLARRSVAVVISGAALVQAVLVWAGWPGWPCPIAHTLGVPCPGCGLTRASVALLKGDWQSALALHAYAPVLLFVLCLFFCASLLPAHPHRALSNGIAAVERRTGLTVVLTVGLVAYWLARLLYAPDAMLRLARG